MGLFKYADDFKIKSCRSADIRESKIFSGLVLSRGQMLLIFMGEETITLEIGLLKSKHFFFDEKTHKNANVVYLYKNENS